MDCNQNVSVAQCLHSDCKNTEEVVSDFGTLDDVFSIHTSEGDMALEWLSTFVEDCLTSPGNCLPPELEVPTKVETNSNTTTPAKGLEALQSEREQKGTFLHRIVIPGKARSKGKRCSTSKAKSPLTNWSYHLNPHDQSFQLVSSDPPLIQVQQAYWLADSELIKPDLNEENSSSKERSRTGKQEESMVVKEVESLEVCKEQMQQRRCTHCLAQRTPQWRSGPLGPKTLCNACGVRYKSGRLLPEYRPAKSPTFVSYKHSNSHKKVLKMRMALL